MVSIESIYQNADVVSVSVSGEINRVMISRDEYNYLINLTSRVSRLKGYGDDVIELDYHGEFMPLINEARMSINK